MYRNCILAWSGHFNVYVEIYEKNSFYSNFRNCNGNFSWIFLIFVLVDNQIGIIAFTLIFMFAFSWGFGPTLWIYSSEVLDSFGCSVVGVINMFLVWVFATFSNLGFMYFTPPEMYFGLVMIQIVCILFVWKYVRETKGKTKEDLKKLYAD